MLFSCRRFRFAIVALLLPVVFSMCKKNVVSDINDIIETETSDVIPVVYPIDTLIGGYYVGLPVHYAQTTKKYPVIIFLHGAGQMGNGNTDLSMILNDGIGKVLKDKKFPPNFKVGMENLSFLVFSPQTSGPPQVLNIGSFYAYVIKTYRVDPHRIYISGLSLGARVATLVAARFPKVFAAMVPIAGVAVNPGIELRCESIGRANLPVWELHNEDDPLANVEDAKYFVNTINSFNPRVPAKITIFPVYGHDAWTTALDPSWKEEGMNIYEWMLQFTR